MHQDMTFNFLFQYNMFCGKNLDSQNFSQTSATKHWIQLAHGTSFPLYLFFCWSLGTLWICSSHSLWQLETGHAICSFYVIRDHCH